MVMADAPPAATVRIDPSASLRRLRDARRRRSPRAGRSASSTSTAPGTRSPSDDHDASGNALFSAIVDPGGTATVDGVSLLAPGTYPFHCIFHAATMRGTLTISGSGGGVQPAPLSFDQPLTRPPDVAHRDDPDPDRAGRTSGSCPTGPLTTMWTYGGTYPGPTIVRPAGKDTKVTFVNRLPVEAPA